MDDSINGEIRALSRARSERIAQREFDAMVDAFYAEGAQILPSAAATVRGREEIRAFWRHTPEDGLVALTLETREVSGTGELAYELGRFSRTLRTRHGSPFQEHGKYVVIYRHQEGSWQAVVEMFNTDDRR